MVTNVKHDMEIFVGFVLTILIVNIKNFFIPLTNFFKFNKMPKNAKKNNKKNQPLKYESVDKVDRWSMCQKIAMLLNRSNRSNDDIELELQELESEYINS